MISEEDKPSAGQVDPMIRKLGKAPESYPQDDSIDTGELGPMGQGTPIPTGRLGRAPESNLLGRSDSPRRLGSRGQKISGLADKLRKALKVTADTTVTTAGLGLSRRPLEESITPGGIGSMWQETSSSSGSDMTKATITPSHSVAFIIPMNHVKLLNFSSGFFPDEILHKFRNRFGEWISKGIFKWNVVRLHGQGRACIEARSSKRKSEWNIGSEYACALCEQRMRLCLVVNGAEQVLLLPRKVGVKEGRQPTDAKYWMR